MGFVALYHFDLLYMEGISANVLNVSADCTMKMKQKNRVRNNRGCYQYTFALLMYPENLSLKSFFPSLVDCYLLSLLGKSFDCSLDTGHHLLMVRSGKTADSKMADCMLYEIGKSNNFQRGNKKLLNQAERHFAVI